jgi:hypothetical protein
MADHRDIADGIACIDTHVPQPPELGTGNMAKWNG